MAGGSDLMKALRMGAVEREATKFLEILYQQNDDQPVKWAAKICIVLQHLRLAGSESSFQYEVMARAMQMAISQTSYRVLRQNGLDPENLESIFSLPPPDDGGVGGCALLSTESTSTPTQPPGGPANDVESGIPQT